MNNLNKEGTPFLQINLKDPFTGAEITLRVDPQRCCLVRDAAQSLLIEWGTRFLLDIEAGMASGKGPSREQLG